MAVVAVVGIGTDVGKTVASAVLLHALKADYWKPVQTGSETDSETIAGLVPGTRIFSEAYHFAEPVSPHYAASLEQKCIDPSLISLPDSSDLIVETAGGILVPLNEKGFSNADLIQQFNCPVFVVTRHYLGSINHTLLTLSELKRRSIEVLGLIVSGNKLESTESVFKTAYPETPHYRIPELDELTPENLQKIAEKWQLKIG